MYYLSEPGLLCNLGDSPRAVVEQLLLPDRAPPSPERLLTPQGDYRVGRISAELAPLRAALAPYDCRNNRLAAAALEQIRPALEAACRRYGPQRVGVVMGTSTSGIDASQRAVAAQCAGGPVPSQYHALQGMLGGLGAFVADYLQTAGPVYTHSSACSSSANALLGARRLLHLGLCDAVVCGGVDSLCELTLQGFGALEAQSALCSRPFTRDRDGINIGEAAAVFVLGREPTALQLLGGAASSDAHHISAPHPEGEGATRAMADALVDAGLTPGQIDYLNLHGTGTPHNDSMEALAVHHLFGEGVPCSSTKAFTGHCLGAASALELALCALLLQGDGALRLPPSLYTDQRDTTLAPIRLSGHNERPSRAPRRCLSNSFAFGGSNVSLIIGSTHD
ncbi:MAG: beta-ketoacyl-ACP synthase [Parahaliea sp.]